MVYTPCIDHLCNFLRFPGLQHTTFNPGQHHYIYPRTTDLAPCIERAEVWSASGRPETTGEDAVQVPSSRCFAGGDDLTGGLPWEYNRTVVSRLFLHIQGRKKKKVAEMGPDFRMRLSFRGGEEARVRLLWAPLLGISSITTTAMAFISDAWISGLDYCDLSVVHIVINLSSQLSCPKFWRCFCGHD